MSQTTLEQEEAKSARSKSNLAFTFFSLEPARREAMDTFYDFCRIVDDIADDPKKPDVEKAKALNTWREAVEQCYRGESPPSFAQPLQQVIQAFDVPRQPLLDIIGGVSMDIGGCHYETFHDLQKYCYGVASAVGLVCIRIFGCQHPQTEEYAINLGYALQFTNILRDVVEDYRNIDRVYLPRQEMRAYGVNPGDFANPAQNPQCIKLFRLCYFRCKHFFNKARRLLPESERENLKAALVMGEIYEAILEKIKEQHFQLTEERIKLSKTQKFRLLWQTLRAIKKPLPPAHPTGTVAVLGGGVAGISAALDLALNGFTPHLYEAKSYLGGRAHSLVDSKTGLTLDNGQHIVMGCYHHFLRIVNLLGIEDKFEQQDTMTVPYVSPEQNWSELRARDLPAPFHLLCGLLTFNELSGKDRLAIMRFGAALRLQGAPDSEETVQQWLQRHEQTPGAIRALWEPFCIAALNESVETASAQLLYATLQQSLFGKANDSRIWLPKVGLSELFHPEAEHYLNSIGGSLELKSQISEICYEQTSITHVTTSRGKKVEADLYVSGLAPAALASLLPEDSPLKANCSQITTSPIISIHLLTDRPLFELNASFVGLLDSPIHWVFDRTHALNIENKDKHLYAIIISAAHKWIELSSSDLIKQLRAELKRFFPPAEDMTFEYHLVYKSRDATFSAIPKNTPLRPQAETPWDNFFLAGDWIDTGLPATLESAAQSALNLVPVLDSRQSI